VVAAIAAAVPVAATLGVVKAGRRTGGHTGLRPPRSPIGVEVADAVGVVVAAAA
jgi:hypothetical protein